MLLPILRDPSFRLFWVSTALSQVGSRATIAANLWQVYVLTGDTAQVGLVGLADAVALLVLGPLGGAIADRVDRRRLLQVSQGVSCLASLALTLATFSGVIQPWHIYLAALVVSAAATFDNAARQALIPSMVPRERLVDAFALVNPTRDVAVLAGPALSGLLITWWGTGSVYLMDTLAHVFLVASLGFIKTAQLPLIARNVSLLRSIADGFQYVKGRPLVWQLMSLDFAAVFFAHYRVLLPALTRDVLHLEAAHYGLLVSAPAAGAILGSTITYQFRNVSRKGVVILFATAGYACAAVLLGQSINVPFAFVSLLGLPAAFFLALSCAAALGLFDAIATTLRHVVVQGDTPDELRGRVTSVYQMVSRGGPSLGQFYMGNLASAVGPAIALSVGAGATILYVLWLATAGRTIRGYRA